MLTRPADLSDRAVIDAVERGWRLRARAIEYRPVGFGSHHWRVDTDDARWFVTADDLLEKTRHRGQPYHEPLGRLRAALSTARALRDEGLTFVVAPESTPSADVVTTVADRFAIAVYPYIDGVSHAYGAYPSLDHCLTVLDLVVAVHGSTDVGHRHALVDDFAIPHRDELITSLDELSMRWDGGPFADRSRALLARHADAVERMLEQHDRLAAATHQRSERLVVTHGEPHAANTITTDGGIVLIDWDTTLVAPPERDLWMLAEDRADILDRYTALTGVATLDDTFELYRSGWDLAEIAIYVAQFRQPHRVTDDTSASWRNLNHYLDPRRWQGVG